MTEPTGLTVDEMIEEFLRAAARGSERDRAGQPFGRVALRELRSALTGYVAAELGAMRPGDVRRDDVEALVFDLGDAGLSRRRLEGIATSVRTLFDYATKRGLAYDNPAERVALPYDDGTPVVEAAAAGAGHAAGRVRDAADRTIAVVLRTATFLFVLVALTFVVESL